MVIVYMGRKTGKRRYTPVNHALIDGDVYCMTGFGAKADRYRSFRRGSRHRLQNPRSIPAIFRQIRRRPPV
jgi:hypothetical protein